MEQYKEIKEESFESLYRFIKAISPVYDYEYPLSFVTLDDNKYLITKVSEIEGYEDDAKRYIIAYDEDNTIKTCSYMNDDEAYGVVYGDKAYRVDINDHAICVEDRNNYFKQMLSYAPDFNDNAHQSYNYIQIDPINAREAYLDYRVDNFNDTSMVLPYLKSRDPKLVELHVYRQFLKSSSKYICEGTKYYNYFRINDQIVLTFPFLKGKTYNAIVGELCAMG